MGESAGSANYLNNPRYQAQLKAMKQQNIVTFEDDQTEDPFAVMARYRPQFNSPISPEGRFNYPGIELSGMPIGELNNRLGNIELDKRGLNAYRERALAAPGTSAWEQMQLAKQATEEAQARDLASAQQAQGAAQARSQLAMKGGLSAGAAERLASSGAKQRMLTGQEVARGGLQARQGIGIEAENQRLNALQNLPGMEVQALQPELQKTSMWANMAQADKEVEARNVANKLASIDAQNRFNQNVYGEQMKAWAAGKQSKAIENSGKK